MTSTTQTDDHVLLVGWMVHHQHKQRISLAFARAWQSFACPKKQHQSTAHKSNSVVSCSRVSISLWQATGPAKQLRQVAAGKTWPSRRLRPGWARSPRSSSCWRLSQHLSSRNFHHWDQCETHQPWRERCSKFCLAVQTTTTSTITLSSLVFFSAASTVCVRSSTTSRSNRPASMQQKNSRLANLACGTS